MRSSVETRQAEGPSFDRNDEFANKSLKENKIKTRNANVDPVK